MSSVKARAKGKPAVVIGPRSADGFLALEQNLEDRESIPESARNKVHNRYLDISPNPETAVKLEGFGVDPADPGTGYINANHVAGVGGDAYIAAMGPLATTLERFWQMIWEQRCPIIVMLTGLVEKVSR